MGTTNIGVVQDPYVPALETAVLLGDLQDVLGRELHIGEEHRQAVATLRNRFPRFRVEDAMRAVVGFGNDGRDRRMDQVQIHLVGDLFERAAHHGQRDRIDHLTSTNRLPNASTRVTIPGSTTVVVSFCSTIAGPSNCMPGARSSRA